MDEDGRPGERRPPVMEDVAELAGVSAMTVSRVLNNPERVRPATRDRVLAAMKTLDYRPNLAARVLATGRSNVLGVVSFDTTLYGPASTLYGIERAARRHDYLISIVSLSELNRRSIGEGVDRLRSQGVDGIIIVAPHESAAEGLRDLPPDLPIVVVGAAEDLPFPLASVDQCAGAVRAVRHLLSLGHETVWHLSGPADWVDSGGRLAGWRQTLAAQGREVPEVLVGDWSAESGYRLGERLARDPSVTAVFAANDAMALGLLRALREAGRRVPEDVSVVGFDDVPEAPYFSPPLTTVRQNFGEVGRRAFTLMLDRISASGADGAHHRQVVEPELVVRDSTGGRR
ncbi:LacI family DNA-binding transcriptional regulator [Thermomonospora cellulosilytica]|uniref:DNA-binding LacI/PurR family transcriptional regulator n=1 Tax=Thermomonospora cellulosilytica TaxID=1411118 RepID=A0A7W3N0I4_9ACTN|nr:LacI family DNA-binding transcriptional regulator [Thermomonospora cellulosilytica]MBA9005286.1 DNA-binding LacI/PurR family transcriptional regulator [Thermomonospora cellulosilytica]